MQAIITGVEWRRSAIERMNGEHVLLNRRVDKLTARFADPKTEAAYQRFISEGDCTTNFRVLLIALPLFPLYGIFDFLNLESPEGALALRLSVSLTCALLLIGFKIPSIRQHHQWIVFATVIMLGATINSVSHFFGTIENAYYVGLVQGAVFVCFLLRISLPKTLIVMAVNLFVFGVAAYSQPNIAEANVQVIALTTMTIVCAIGAYLFQRFRRYDFQKVLIIEEQNAQLNELLADAERGNERKIAALNMLVHFVKTPLHQITGFSEILVGETARGDGAAASAENARYIKDATANLTKSINGLLAYHRLDESGGKTAPEAIAFKSAVEDFCGYAPADIEIGQGDVPRGAFMADAEIFRTAMEALADHYAEQSNDGLRLVVSVDCDPAGEARLIVRDNGDILSTAQFEERVKPLTKIDNYLSHAGDQMPMALRTVARALEIMGGRLAHAALANGNRYELIAPAAAEKAAAKKAAAA